MEADEKPLKLGELWMMTTSGFKKIFKQRFLILTNKEQVIWYRKQEVQAKPSAECLPKLLTLLFSYRITWRASAGERLRN